MSPASQRETEDKTQMSCLAGASAWADPQHLISKKLRDGQSGSQLTEAEGSELLNSMLQVQVAKDNTRLGGPGVTLQWEGSEGNSPEPEETLGSQNVQTFTCVLPSPAG